ncbi:MAG: hypothetical protein MMC33_002892 [Icmadophila ericetorum]|nr:hypothetical protein [Icmadophila ericetorum]
MYSEDFFPTATIGLSSHAASQLGDIVYIEPPTEHLSSSTAVPKGDPFSAVESVKSASEIYAPVSIKITDFNERLNDESGLVNEDPEGEGWLVKGEVEDKAEVEALMGEKEYESFVKDEKDEKDE